MSAFEPHIAPGSPTSVVALSKQSPSQDDQQSSELKSVAFSSTSVNDNLSIAMSNMSVVKPGMMPTRMVSTPPEYRHGSPQRRSTPYIPREITSKGSNGGITCQSSWGDVPTLSTYRTRSGSVGEYSFLDDPNIAPPPVLSFPKERLDSPEVVVVPGTKKAQLPLYDNIRHSGYIMTRFKVGDLLAKKWYQNFWILYGERFYFFNTKEDFETWLLNPYLTVDERNDLVNFRLSLFDKVTLKKYKFRLGAKSLKLYQNSGNMHRFKITKHANLGITRSNVVVGAFASLNEVDVTELHGVIDGLMKLGPSASSSDISSTDDNSYPKTL